MAVVLQDRADGTRVRILDAAADLFAESGFSNVSLSDVVARAGVSRGALNYHFPTKESLGAALVSYSEAEMLKRLVSEASESASALENLIRASFAQQNLILQNRKVAVGIQLAQAMDQVSGTTVRAAIPNWTALVAMALDEAKAAGDLEGHVDARKTGYVLWCSITANNMMAAPSGMLPTEGLAVVWQVHLRGIVPAESAGYFEQLVQRVAAQYGSRSTTGPHTSN